MTIDTRKFRYVAAALLAVVVAAGAYAFTASNTVPATNAGSGSGTISGYDVTNVSYALNGTDPTTVDSVSFTLDKSAGTVKAQVQTGGSWYDCSNGGSGNDWTCSMSPAADLQSADKLTVVATD
jgi:hypothetical protein